MNGPAASLHKNIEFFLLEQDLKPVLRHGYYDEELPAIANHCRHRGLHVVRSSFRVRPVEEGFSDKGVTSDEGMSFFYVSKDELLAHKAALAEVQKDHVKLGLLLGYPECCCSFFAEHAAHKEKADYNFEDLVLEHSKRSEYPFYMNILQRHEDFCVLSHFPCSLDCKESQERGKIYYWTLLKIQPKLAKNMRRALRGRKHIMDKKILFR